MGYITVGKENSQSIDIYYEDHGEGQPVVLIHGFPLSGAAWEKEVAALLHAGYRTITYDRRGFGKSSKPTIGYDYDTFAEDLNKIMTELNLSESIVIGHSMGTGEVTRYISNFGSKRVNKAICISPIPPFLLKTNDNPEGVEKSVFDKIMQTIIIDRPAYQTNFFHDFYNLDQTLGKKVSEEVVQLNWNIAVEASPIGTLACVLTWLTDFRPDLPKINIPLLIIQGDADRILPFPATGKRMHEVVKESQLLVIKGGSHGIPWTHAEEINKAILDFINQK